MKLSQIKNMLLILFLKKQSANNFLLPPVIIDQGSPTEGKGQQRQSLKKFVDFSVTGFFDLFPNIE